ncbi:unnamed protein product [Paramecium octaurelia]|uniref:Transmembrane protein n=1 Tax=Paramecium octaurelia TaxID=43137 RepID=A0A8S1WQD3_PAROT|nr:unnamed protein product [Paramecium octaurelia]
MNTIIIKRKLCTLYEIIREQKQQTYLNPDLVWLMYTGTRFSLILRLDQFNEKEYQDQELILVKNIINWFHLLTPISQIQLITIKSVLAIIIAAFHILSILMIVLEIKQSNFLNQYQNIFYTYFQILILYPSFIHIYQIQNHNPNNILVWCCTIPLFINYMIFSYFQRNYLLPIKNPFTKRYRIQNYLQNFIEIIILVAMPYFEEIVQTTIMMLLFLLQLIDALFNQPYSMQINLNYCFCSSILLFGSAVKCLSISFSQKEYLFYSLMLVPLLSLFMKRILILTYSMNLEENQLSKSLLFQIADEFYSKNPITQSKILFILKNKYKIMANKQTTKQSEPWQNHYILMLLLRLYDTYSQQQKNKEEELQLYIIFFIFWTQEKLNLAYIQLKQHQMQSSHQSIYFQIIKIYCSKLILQRINQDLKSSQGRLDLSSVKQSHSLIEKSMPLITEILILKNKFLDSLSIGYDRIEQLSQKCVNLSDKIVELKNLVFEDMEIDILVIQKQIIKFNILDLRLLSLVFGSVLNDYHITFQIEQRIEDLLNQERNVLSRGIQNTSLLNDDVIIMQISMMKSQGQILNKDKTKILKYFKFPNDESFKSISQLNQLLPEYLVVKHDRFLKEFLTTGESKLFNTSHDVFPSYYSGFSFLVTLQLIPSYDEMDDYVLSAILKKTYEHGDFIIFDESGKILGLSDQMLQILVHSDSEFSKALLNSYIYFWFKDLLIMINQQMESMQEYTQQFTLFTQAAQIQPITNLQELIQSHDQYQKQHFLKSNRTDQDQQYEQKQMMKVSFYEINYVIQMYDFINDNISKFTQNQIGFQVTFNLQFQKMQGQHPLFILQITEYVEKQLKFISPKSIGTISPYSSISKIRSPPQQSDLNSLSNADMDELHQELVINQTIINKLILRQEMEDARVFIQNGQDGENFQAMMEKENKESNLISPRSHREILMQKGLIEDDSEDIKGNESNIIKSSSQRENIEIGNKQAEFQIENQSRSSATSDKTQNSVYHLIRNLQYKITYQTGIVKAICNTICLSAFLIILVGVQLNVERNNSDELQYRIPLVRLPQRFNRLYCTFTAIGQLQLQNKLLNISYGEYYEYRIRNESAQKRNELQNLISDLRDQFSHFQLPPLTIRIINEYIYQLDNTTMLQFDIIANEYTSQINQYLQIQDQTLEDVFKIETLLEFLKGNLIAQLKITINVVDEIEREFFDFIDYSSIEQLVFLTVMLLIILIFLIIQIHQWQQPYKYMQVILLLISKISDKDIEIAVSKTLYLLDRIISNPYQTKNINYFRDCFWYSNKIYSFQSVRKSSEYSKSNQNGKNQQQKQKKSSRIQDTSLSILNIKIILLLIWLCLSGFAFSAYIIMNQNMNASLPELRLTMEFVKFKQDLDGIMILCFLLKNQQSLIEETIKAFALNPELNTRDKYFQTQYKELIEEFKPLLVEMDEIYSHIYNDIVASTKISDDNKNLLLNLYEKDLCQIIPTILPFCAYDNGVFLYFPTYPSASSLINNQQTYKYGINGIYQQIISILNTHYNLEKNGIIDTNLTNANLFLENSEFIQIILPYFFDLSYAILEFYYTIIQSTLDVLESDYNMILEYYIAAGIGCLIILYSVTLIRAITLQKKVRLILQAIILIPYESLIDQAIIMTIRKIDRTL